MDSLENYLLAVMKENKVTLEPNDPLCVLHTILSKFEDDLLESQRKCLEAFKSDIEASCSSIEATEKLRAERALSYIQAQKNCSCGFLKVCVQLVRKGVRIIRT